MFRRLSVMLLVSVVFAVPAVAQALDPVHPDTFLYTAQTVLLLLGMAFAGYWAYEAFDAAAIAVDGRIVAAAQEERFTRKKHDSGFPLNAVRFCLEFAGLKPAELDYVAFYDKPFLKFERLLETYLAFAPRGFTSFRQALPLWIKEKLFQKSSLVHELEESLDGQVDWRVKLLFSEHHMAHAASAFFPSPFAAWTRGPKCGERSPISIRISPEYGNLQRHRY